LKPGKKKQVPKADRVLNNAKSPGGNSKRKRPGDHRATREIKEVGYSVQSMSEEKRMDIRTAEWCRFTARTGFLTWEKEEKKRKSRKAEGTRDN